MTQPATRKHLKVKQPSPDQQTQVGIKPVSGPRNSCPQNPPRRPATPPTPASAPSSGLKLQRTPFCVAMNFALCYRSKHARTNNSQDRRSLEQRDNVYIFKWFANKREKKFTLAEGHGNLFRANKNTSLFPLCAPLEVGEHWHLIP